MPAVQNTKSKYMYILAYVYLIISIILFLTLLNSFFEIAMQKTDGPTDPVKPIWYYFYYFTYQSNLIVLIYFILFIITVFSKKFNSDSKLYKLVYSRFTIVAITLYITLTFLVVVGILDEIYNGGWNIVDAGVTHGFCPIAMWFLFFFLPCDSKKEYSIKNKNVWINTLYILIYPFLYAIMALIIGSCFKDGVVTPANPPVDELSAFPYDFLNYVKNGWGSFFIYFIALLVIVYFLGIGLLIGKQKIDKVVHNK